MLGRVNVDVHACRLQLQEEHVRGMASVEQHVPVGLFDGVGYQLVPNHPTVDEKILQIGLAA